jgi:hypothetical protein
MSRAWLLLSSPPAVQGGALGLASLSTARGLIGDLDISPAMAGPVPDTRAGVDAALCSVAPLVWLLVALPGFGRRLTGLQLRRPKRFAAGPRSLGIEGVPQDSGARTHSVSKGASR